MNFHVIKDPVHGTMQFTSLEDSWIKPFIDSANFQRLRHIKQLGMGDFIFPGAVHTRFNHSLGCCYIASQIAQKIGLADEERQLVMIACLLHDIGHGPFSHTFEGLFQQKLIRHEDWTPYFLADYDHPEFFKKYNQTNPRYHLTSEKFSHIAGMIMHQPIGKTVLADIVSSQLDADRLDYLLRDNHFCGVRYGDYDLRWLLHCLAIVKSDEGERLGINHKGIGAIEHYLMARRLMMRNIYHGQKKLALEFFLVQLLAILAENLEDERFAALQQSRLSQFLIAANRFNKSILSKSSKELMTIKRQFLENHYSNYKELCDYDLFALIRQLLAMKESNHPAIQLAERLHTRKMPKIVRLDAVNVQKTLDQLIAFKKQHADSIQDWQLALIETPHQSYSGEEAPILVIDENNQTKPISEFSIMLNALSDKYEHTIFLAIDYMLADNEHVIKFVKQLN